MTDRLIVFTRYPTPGSTKTRLIPALGAEGAADLQRQMTEHTLSVMGPLLNEEIKLQVRYEGGEESHMKKWLGEDLSFAPQGEGDLGERMSRAFREAFADGFTKAVVIGTDCPSLGAKDTLEAFDLLESNTLVLGPATDGGYFLIAIRSDSPPWMSDLIFKDIPWGTGQVFNTTMNALAETGLDVGLLDEKADVDEPEDLIFWEEALGTQDTGHRTQENTEIRISVIIPTFNEEEQIGKAIESLKSSDVEIVVADGGSGDGTLAICEEAGVKVVHSEPGRARQMNAGASGAAGNVFLFLHADTQLPDQFGDRVGEAISEGAVAGAFLFGTDMDTASMNIIENMAHFRTYRMGMVYGDQAIFSMREAFFRAGTYPDQPVMEDYELWKRLGRVGKRSLIPLSVTTSSRKWKQHGVWRITLLNQAVMWLYLLGVGPERLARWYQGKLRKKTKSSV